MLPKIFYENEWTVNRRQYITFIFSLASNHFTDANSLICSLCTIDGLYLSISKWSSTKQNKWKGTEITKVMSGVLTLLIHNSCLLIIFKIRIPFAPFVQLCQSTWCQLKMCRHLCAPTIQAIFRYEAKECVVKWKVRTMNCWACSLLYQDWRFVLMNSASNEALLLKNTSAFAESASIDGMNLAVKMSKWINFSKSIPCERWCHKNHSMKLAPLFRSIKTFIKISEAEALLMVY